MSSKSQQELARHINALCTKIKSRMIGQAGDHASAQYVEAHFRKLGLRILDNVMPCMGWDLLSASLKVDGKKLPAVGQMYSPAGKVRAPLVLAEVQLADSGFKALKGKAVAVYGNFEPYPDRLMAFSRKAERAAVACVIAIDDNNQDTASTKLIRDKELKRMPSVAVSLEAGYKLAKLDGKTVELVLQSRRYKSTTRDVIGVLDAGPREICVEAHRDAAPDTPSADDNGSGSAVLLELARLLAGEKLNHTVRFVSATAEEFGNVGTAVYAKKFKAELQLIDLMMNADCVGGALCPNRAFVGPRDPVFPVAESAIRRYPTIRLVEEDKRDHGHIIEYLGPKVSCVNVVNDWKNARIHTARDEPSNLSFRKLEEVSLFLRDVIVGFDRQAK